MKPITIAAAEPDFQYVHVDVDGTETDHYDLTFTPENWQMIREGRACLRCWELQPIGFLVAPTATAERTVEAHLPGCPYTGDGIRKRQLADIGAEFYGEKWIGPKQKLEDAIAEDDEKRRKLGMDTGRDASTRVLPAVPGWVKL